MNNKSYLVTGASRGIGKKIAETLISKGHKVIGLARKFTWEAPLLHPISVDLSNLDKLPQILGHLKKEISALDGIICVAGQGKFGSLEQFSYKQIREMIDLNFLSHVYLIRTFLPLFKQTKQGDILVIGSEAALLGKREGSIYCASKFALRGFCQALRDECATSSIRVTLINPGMVKTSFFDELSFTCGEHFAEHILPEDVADAVHHVLTARPGVVFDEINLSPQKKRIVFKTQSTELND